MLFSVRVQTCFTYSSHIWSMWYHLNICWLWSGLCQWSRHWWPVVFICISEEKRKRNLFFYLLKCIGLTHCIKQVLTSIPYKWLKKRHVICFKYLLTAKLTVPMKLNLTTGHFFCIPWNKFVSLVRVHWLDSIWFMWYCLNTCWLWSWLCQGKKCIVLTCHTIFVWLSSSCIPFKKSPLLLACCFPLHLEQLLCLFCALQTSCALNISTYAHWGMN